MAETTKNLPVTAEEKHHADDAAAARAAAEQPKELDDLHTEFGDTTIAESVVQKIAGIATREVPGVFAMGNIARRTISNLTQRFPGGQPDVTGGVAVQKGERETAIDVSIVVAYGAPIVEVSQEIRENVIRAVENGTGLKVVSVNVDVTDVQLPDDEREQQSEKKSDNAELA